MAVDSQELLQRLRGSYSLAAEAKSAAEDSGTLPPLQTGPSSSPEASRSRAVAGVLEAEVSVSGDGSGRFQGAGNVQTVVELSQNVSPSSRSAAHAGDGRQGLAFVAGLGPVGGHEETGPHAREEPEA